MNTEESKDGKLKAAMSKNKKLIIIIASIVVLVTGICGAYVLSVKNKVEAWNDKIYPGVQAYGIDLGGKTKEEAIDLINTQLLSLIGDKVIKVSVGDNSFELKYSDVNPTVSADETVEEALEYGKDAKLFEKKKMIENGVEVNVDTVLSYDEEKVNEFANNVNNQVKVEAVDATISISGSNISVTQETNGKHIE